MTGETLAGRRGSAAAREGAGPAPAAWGLAKGNPHGEQIAKKSDRRKGKMQENWPRAPPHPEGGMAVLGSIERRGEILAAATSGATNAARIAVSTWIVGNLNRPGFPEGPVR